MIISDKYKYIFIGIPKTATTSTRHAFNEIEDRELTKGGTKTKTITLPLGHKDNVDSATALQIKSHNPEIWDSYFKFAFVRNPWDRVVSWYFHALKRGIILPNNIAYKTADKLDFGRHKMKQLSGKFTSVFSSPTKEFKKWLLNDFEKTTTVITPGSLKEPLHAMLPCLDWVSDEQGKIIIDFVGRFENINSDFETVSKKIGVDVKLPHVYKSENRKKDYREYYDDVTREFVAEKFKKDIDFFGYTFEK